MGLFKLKIQVDTPNVYFPLQKMEGSCLSCLGMFSVVACCQQRVLFSELKGRYFGR